MSLHPIPRDYPAITPYIIVDDAALAISFYQAVFGEEERMRLTRQDGRIGHAELRIRDAIIMLADEHPEIGARGPKTFGGSPISLHLYVEDADRVVAHAVELGARVTREIDDQFYGDRMGIITDPFGHIWSIASRIEDVSPEELKRRAIATAAGEDWHLPS